MGRSYSDEMAPPDGARYPQSGEIGDRKQLLRPSSPNETTPLSEKLFPLASFKLKEEIDASLPKSPAPHWFEPRLSNTIKDAYNNTNKCMHSFNHQ
jgi:hypothetical protein